jgi:predicted AlkP superfamily phosphohydrolase/phosphomutase/Flp pilus assembly protein TadD
VASGPRWRAEIRYNRVVKNTRGFLQSAAPVAALLSAVLVAASCGGGESPRVIVLGIDGLDPQTIDLLMAEGQMPNFARLRQDGAYGKLKAAKPLLSPILWTTIATGKGPAEHGIGHFVAVDAGKGGKLPVTSAMRQVKPVWQIASEQAGIEVATVGWWATWPPEEVNGYVVSDHTCYHFLFEQGASDGAEMGVTYPPQLADEIAPLIRRPQDVGAAEAARYVDVPAADFERAFDFEDDLSHFRWALASAESYRDIGLSLWQRYAPELLMVYIEGTDSISHLFGHLFRVQGYAGELAEQQRRYGRAVGEIYRLADEMVGEYMEAMDDRTTLVVLSDHGFKLGQLRDDPSKTRDLRRISERDHRENGIVYIYGNRVRPHSRIIDATQFDITPSLLALLGLDVARDMQGRVLTEALDVAAPARQIASYEDGRRSAVVAGGDAQVDEQILAHLQALGYIEGEATSSAGERNMAAIHFEAGRYEEAAAIYRKLVADEPDDPFLLTSLAGCLGAMGRYQEALEPLERALQLNAVNPEAYHNRAVLHERLGNLEQAVADYRTALRYSPNYEPSQRALIRLTGSAASRAEPLTPAQQRASEIANEASMQARRGDYVAAMRLLDEAEKIAPDLVLVYQYQANVAYLMQDLERARRALRKALQLEPDNALFERNLANIEQEIGAVGSR